MTEQNLGLFEYEVNLNIQRVLAALDELRDIAGNADASMKELADSMDTLERSAESNERVQQFLREGLGDASRAGQVLATNLQKVQEKFRELRSEGNLTFDQIVESMRQANNATGEFSFAELRMGTEAIREQEKEVERLADESLRAAQAAEVLKGSTTQSAQELEEMRKRTELARKQIQELRDTTLDSFKDIETAVSKTGKDTGLFGPEDVKRASQEIQQYEKTIQQLRNTLREVKAEEERQNQTLRSQQQILNATSAEYAKYRAEVDRAKNILKQLSNNGQRDIDSLAKAMLKLNTNLNPDAIRRAARELKGMGRRAQETRDRLETLNKTFRNFFGITLAGIGIRVMSEIGQQFRQLAERGEEVSRTAFTFGVSIRALQRAGVDITFAEVNKQLDILSKKFGIFTDQQLREGTAQVFLLTRNLKLTKEQMFELQNAVGTLALITGKDFGEQGLLVARAVASGYTEALQRAGIEASRTAISIKAVEMGINKSFMAMTQAERATVTLALITEQLAFVEEDAALFAETLAGKLALVAQNLGNVTDALSQDALPIWIKILEWWTKFIELLNEGIVALKQVWVILGAGRAALEAYTKAIAGGVSSTKELREILESTFTKEFKMRLEDLFPDDLGKFEDTEIGKQLRTLPLELERELDNLEDQFGDILRNFGNNLRDIYIDYFRRFDEINLEVARDTEDQEIEVQQKRNKIARETNDKILDAQQKFREKELKAARKFEEDLKKIREKALFDLEDALRERDAKQVLRILKQAQLQETQLNRQYALEELERKEAFQNELADIEKQRQRKLRELEIENEERLAEIELQRKREMEDREEWLAQELDDLKRHKNDRLDILREELSAEGQLLFDALQSRVNTYAEYQKQITAIRAAVGQQLLDMLNQGQNFQNPAPLFINPLVPVGPPGYYPPTGPGTSPGAGGGGGSGFGFAHGGTLVARKPTLAMFGEGGAEVAHFAPLNRVGRNEGRIFGGTLPGRMGNGESMASVMVQLSPGLRGSIVDETLGEVAVVIKEME